MAAPLQRVAGLLWVPWDSYGVAAGRLVDTALALRAAAPDLDLLVACQPGTEVRPLSELGLPVAEAAGRSEAVTSASRGGRRHVLLVGDGVRVPPGLLERAAALVEADVRIASVAFWSNAAGPLSFPHLATPVEQPPLGHDERTLTAALRAAATSFGAVPVLAPTGGLALLSASGLSAAGGLGGDDRSIDAALVEYGLRCRGRGMLNLLDAATYIMRSADTAERPPATAVLDAGERAWLAALHPVTGASIDDEVADPASPLRIAHHRARTAVSGLRVAIEGRCIGPLEMGTQVQILSLVAALAERPEVASVHIAMPSPVPGYARPHLEHPAIHVHHTTLAEAADAGHADIVHRPYQPDGPIDMAELGGTERRVLLTLQDLISYRTGPYFADRQRWQGYRADLRAAVAGADAVVAISDDVAGAITDEMLPVDPDRLVVVPNGTDHLSAASPERVPGAFLDPLWAARSFVLVLGATYAHKQRDLAIAAVDLLRSQGRDTTLVLAGAQVPVGSSRRTEAAARAFGLDVLELPDVSSEERTWLLRHADVLLYPSAAEGFGLVPFEAATFGTPSLAVDFGPLHEVSSTPPVHAASWAPSDLAAALAALLDDPALRGAQVAHLAAAGRAYTWAHTAERIVAAYDAVLARPSRPR